MDLKGKRAVVTGATAGIGKATALALHEAGCDVLAVGRRQDRLDALPCRSLRLDITDRAAVEATDWGRVDILVNNAGLALGTEPVQAGDPADWDTVLATNVNGLLYVTRAILPDMMEAGRGDIVNLGSVAGRWVYPGGAVYCASKHAVRAISEGIRFDVQASGIRVINIEPGLVETEFSKVRFKGDEDRAAAVYEGADVLRPEDVAETILWTVARPVHVNVQELVLYPTCQASVRDVVRHNT